ncbi:MAG: hypothetical protein HZC02_02795 [Candidatus Levybacteria bacterium]|nr:hypothetical protein [Candidatus Levybacteria bacterium]
MNTAITAIQVSAISRDEINVRMRSLKAAKARLDEALHFSTNLRDEQAVITTMDGARLPADDNDLLNRVTNVLLEGLAHIMIALREQIKSRLGQLYALSH